jgi:hypothetical protein
MVLNVYSGSLALHLQEYECVEEYFMTVAIDHPQLQPWANEHEPAEALIYGKRYWEQIIFVRDVLTSVFARSYEQYRQLSDNIRVIGTHRSKSVELPVYQLTLDNGVVITMRHNFYDWKVSISSPREIEMDFMSLASATYVINPVYCEGFPREVVYGSYAQNRKQFTLEIGQEHKLYTFMWVFSHHVLGIREPKRG